MRLVQRLDVDRSVSHRNLEMAASAGSTTVLAFDHVAVESSDGGSARGCVAYGNGDCN